MNTINENEVRIENLKAIAETRRDGYERKWDCEKGDIIKGVRVLTVEKVTNKLVFFKDEYRQYKKDYVLRSLARGIDNGGFSYLADIDLTNIAISRPVSR